jgi:hypothetical protein
MAVDRDHAAAGSCEFELAITLTLNPLAAKLRTAAIVPPEEAVANITERCIFDFNVQYSKIALQLRSGPAIHLTAEESRGVFNLLRNSSISVLRKSDATIGFTAPIVGFDDVK